MAVKKDAADGKWKNVATGSGDFVKFKKGVKVEGEVKEIATYKYKKKTRRKMICLNKQTGEIFALGEYAQLSNLFSQVKKGNEIRVTCTGAKKLKAGQNPMLTFKVEMR